MDFGRCVYCFAEKTENGPCGCCGYDHGLCDSPVWWLAPGTVLKGRYVIGQPRKSSSTELSYLGWDLERETLVQIVEYYPKTLVTRDITASDGVSCIPGQEWQMEAGRQAFFEKAKLFYHCVSRVQALEMDFFVRNGTCYYVRAAKQIRPQRHHTVS